MRYYTDAEIVEHVQRTARYVKEFEPQPYVARFRGKLYTSEDTRDLVLQMQDAEADLWQRHDVRDFEIGG